MPGSRRRQRIVTLLVWRGTEGTHRVSLGIQRARTGSRFDWKGPCAPRTRFGYPAEFTRAEPGRPAVNGLACSFGKPRELGCGAETEWGRAGPLWRLRR